MMMETSNTDNDNNMMQVLQEESRIHIHGPLGMGKRTLVQRYLAHQAQHEDNVIVVLEYACPPCPPPCGFLWKHVMQGLWTPMIQQQVLDKHNYSSARLKSLGAKLVHACATGGGNYSSQPSMAMLQQVAARILAWLPVLQPLLVEYAVVSPSKSSLKTTATTSLQEETTAQIDARVLLLPRLCQALMDLVVPDNKKVVIALYNVHYYHGLAAEEQDCWHLLEQLPVWKWIQTSTSPTASNNKNKRMIQLACPPALTVQGLARHGSRLPSQVLPQALQATKGNPLAVQQVEVLCSYDPSILWALLSFDDNGSSHMEWTVQEILSRVWTTCFTDQERHVLTTCAVALQWLAASSLSVHLLEDLLQDHLQDEQDDMVLHQALQKGMDLKWWTVQDNRIAFGHDIFGMAAAAQASPTRMHRVLQGLLEYSVHDDDSNLLLLWTAAHQVNQASSDNNNNMDSIFWMAPLERARWNMQIIAMLQQQQHHDAASGLLLLPLAYAGMQALQDVQDETGQDPWKVHSQLALDLVQTAARGELAVRNFVQAQALIVQVWNQDVHVVELEDKLQLSLELAQGLCQAGDYLTALQVHQSALEPAWPEATPLLHWKAGSAAPSKLDAFALDTKVSRGLSSTSDFDWMLHPKCPSVLTAIGAAHWMGVAECARALQRLSLASFAVDKVLWVSLQKGLLPQTPLALAVYGSSSDRYQRLAQQLVHDRTDVAVSAVDAAHVAAWTARTADQLVAAAMTCEHVGLWDAAMVCRARALLESQELAMSTTSQSYLLGLIHQVQARPALYSSSRPVLQAAAASMNLYRNVDDNNGSFQDLTTLDVPPMSRQVESEAAALDHNFRIHQAVLTNDWKQAPVLLTKGTTVPSVHAGLLALGYLSQQGSIVKQSLKKKNKRHVPSNLSLYKQVAKQAIAAASASSSPFQALLLQAQYHAVLGGGSNGNNSVEGILSEFQAAANAAQGASSMADVAMAYQLAGVYLLKQQGDSYEEQARTLLSKAIGTWQEWGATKMVARLEEDYSDVLLQDGGSSTLAVEVEIMTRSRTSNSQSGTIQSSETAGTRASNNSGSIHLRQEDEVVMEDAGTTTPMDVQQQQQAASPERTDPTTAIPLVLKPSVASTATNNKDAMTQLTPATVPTAVSSDSGYSRSLDLARSAAGPRIKLLSREPSSGGATPATGPSIYQ